MNREEWMRDYTSRNSRLRATAAALGLVPLILFGIACLIGVAHG